MSCSSNLGTVGAICHSKGEFYERFDWKVENFSSLSNVVDGCYHSPPFDFVGRSWYLDFFPNGELRCPGGIQVYLTMKSPESPKHVNFLLGIKTVKGNVEKWENGCATFEEGNFAYGINDCKQRSEILERKSELLPSDCMTITAVIAVFGPDLLRDTLDVSVQTEPDIIVTKEGRVKALDDIGKLFISGDNSDVTVKVRDVEFKAHRAILAARNPVLYAMFQHNMAEKTSNEITISDCEPDIFKEFMCYIYTGTIKDLTAQNVFPLYGVANKYLENDLKSQCLTYIQDTLCVATFCDTVKLALAYEEEQLLGLAIEFAARNIQSIIKSVEWQNFIQKHPLSANEILIKSLCPPT